jgi:hypothetical protein
VRILFFIAAFSFFPFENAARKIYGAKSSLCGMLLPDFLYAPNLSIDKPYLDPMWVRNGVGQNILDDPAGQFSCSLVLLEDD